MLMIMGRLTITWHCYLLVTLYFYLLFKVDCTHSNQTPFNSSSPNYKECSVLLQFKNITYKSFPECLPCSGSEPPNVDFFSPCSEIDSGPAVFDRSGPCSKTDSWMEGKDCCSWDGVLCDFETGNVIQLNLCNTCLKGTLNLSFFIQFPHLQCLDLSGNSLIGLIPASLSKLKNLSQLHLSKNMLSGPIPHSLCDLPNLSQLLLSTNILDGGLPSCLFNMSSLSSIDLSRNKFNGPIPHSLCDLTELSFLDMSNNFLSNRLLSCLFNMSLLEYIDLSNNQLSSPIGKFKPTSTVLQDLLLGNNKINGPIPSFIFELVNLTHLDLSSNNLTGTFKFDMLTKYCKRLDRLVLSGNSLLSFTFNVNVKDTSSISLEILELSSCNLSEFPSFLSSLKNLMELDLSNSRIHGQILKIHSKGWPGLKYLNLSHNFLTYVEHPWEEIEMIDLYNNSLQGSLLVPPLGTRFLFVSDNMLTGTIPPSFCNLSTLFVLDLSNNNLGGKIPECLGSYSILGLLLLRNNSFHGRIPNTFCNKSELTNLDLSYNNLEGSLPRSLNSCTSLEILNVGNNNLTDIFPYWLGTLSNLKIFVLKSNQFYGSINDSKVIFASLRILDLSYNKFVGHLSKKFFEHLQGMMFPTKDVYVYDQYMGTLCIGCSSIYFPDLKYYLSLQMKGQLVKFQKILLAFRAMDLSNNCFEGSIPKILGNFRLLIVLNLSHNSLTGNIPSSFENLIALESLDLSSNKHDGRIPEEMKSLTFLEVLNLSYNRLSGPIPQGAQFATFESESFVGNEGLCGKPLLKSCNNDSVPLLPPSFLPEEDDNTNGFSWKIAMMGYGYGLVIGLSIGYIVVSTGKLQWLERMVKVQLHKKARRSR